MSERGDKCVRDTEKVKCDCRRGRSRREREREKTHGHEIIMSMRDTRGQKER